MKVEVPATKCLKKVSADEAIDQAIASGLSVEEATIMVNNSFDQQAYDLAVASGASVESAKIVATTFYKDNSKLCRDIRNVSAVRGNLK